MSPSHVVVIILFPSLFPAHNMIQIDDVIITITHLPTSQTCNNDNDDGHDTENAFRKTKRLSTDAPSSGFESRIF